MENLMNRSTTKNNIPEQVIQINDIEIYTFENMKSLCTHKLHANLPNTSNQLVYKAIISDPAQKNSWVVQFTIYTLSH